MNSQTWRTLEILTAVESVPDLTQRSLAERMQVSVGTANGLVQELVGRGWIHLERQNGRLDYRITNHGKDEKLRLLRLHFVWNLDRYAELKEQMVSRFRKLDPDARRLAFLGAGQTAEVAYVAACQSGYEVVAAIDEERKSESFFGILVKGPQLLAEEPWDFDLLTLASCRRADRFRRTLEALSFPRSQVVDLTT